MESRSSLGESSLLRVRGVTVKFGGIIALSDVSFDVGAEAICGVIGPNGAGKTTLFNCLSRLYVPVSGSIGFGDVELLQRPPHRMASLGIGRTFQNLALFPSVTVKQNVMVGAHSRFRSGFLSDVLRLPFVGREEREANLVADELIDLVGLNDVRDEVIRTLPFGTQKRVELARALASQPKLLLLDEPAAGLNHEEVEELRSLILVLRKRFRMAVLLVEHHMNLVMQVSDKVVALNFGRIIADGTPSEVQSNNDVVRAYLGGVE